MSPSVLAAIAFAVVIGALLPLQALINARLGQLTHGPLLASLISFLVGTLVLTAALLATRTALPDARMVGAVPAWAWLGGVIGAVFVVGATLLVPRLGAAALVCLVVFGQIAGSLVLDHFGVLTAPKPADALRIVGVVLVAVGALLVVRPWQST